MTRRALVLRPEPSAGATLSRLAAAGVNATAVPLFVVVPVAWARPAGRFDALLVTSANAMRHGGAALASVRDLPVVAVGAVTAAAARAAGFDVIATGTHDAMTAAAGRGRLLHLAGRDRIALPAVTAVTVYASEDAPVAGDALNSAVDGVVLLHSARAAMRFVALAAHLPRARIRIAALSNAVAEKAGGGWARVAVAPRPTDAAIVAIARSLAIDP